MEEGNLAGPSYTQHAAAGHACYGYIAVDVNVNKEVRRRTARWTRVGGRSLWSRGTRLSDVGSAVTR